MDRTAVVKAGAMASATVCALFGGVVLAQYIFTKKQRAGKKTKIIEMMPEFEKSTIHIRDPERVEQIICSLIKGGATKLQIITDFDMTLSRFAVNGKRCPTCHTGLGDVLEEIIKQAGVYHPNVKVVSNFMDFDDNGVLKGFKGELIHVYNKHDGALRNTEYFKQLKDNGNIILLGDSLGDLNMADGVPNVENILKIGFLNDKVIFFMALQGVMLMHIINVEELLEKYMDSYDIVLMRDETLEVPNSILQKIL
ncbi:Cytosolic 5'-nucleotidase 3A [Triplophysa tibetana]|uniref:5'-nucleotidase n=1 Tax=Triplophysa tibetana TaxID=1572043 RepID=A0A5A9MYP9_9TELE|nr:Cytosolic 5'-nucleotidase 3A [Triplophysa tibetana]